MGDRQQDALDMLKTIALNTTRPPKKERAPKLPPPPPKTVWDGEFDFDDDELQLVTRPLYGGKMGDQLKNRPSNVIFLLENSKNFQNILKYNELNQHIYLTRPLPWDKRETRPNGWDDFNSDMNLELMAFFEQHKQFNFEVSKETLISGVLHVAKKRSFHPIRAWLNTLIWDGTPRLDTWLQRICHVEDTQLHRAYSRKWMLGAVARVFDPGCKFDHAIVLEGPEGLGKSMLARLIGGDFSCALSLDPSDPKIVSKMIGQWIIELKEMECATRGKHDALKAFITETHDRDRLPYRPDAETIARQQAFIGSYNPRQDGSYLNVRDLDAAERRWWMLLITEHIDTMLFSADREQLFAEAVQIYKTIGVFTDAHKSGEKLWLENEILVTQHQQSVQDRKEDSPLKDKILDWILGTFNDDSVLPEKRYGKLYRESDAWDALGRISTVFTIAHRAEVRRAFKQIGFLDFKKMARCKQTYKTGSGWKINEKKYSQWVALQRIDDEEIQPEDDKIDFKAMAAGDSR